MNVDAAAELEPLTFETKNMTSNGKVPTMTSQANDVKTATHGDVRQWRRGKLTLILLVLQAVFLILFGVFVRYDDIGMPNPVTQTSSNDSTETPAAASLALAKQTEIPNYYAMFQDIHVMMFIGFGFLMTFLKRYGFGSVGFNFLVAAFVLQWATLTHGFIREFYGGHTNVIHIDLVAMINADFAAAAVLISFGAVLGKVSATQLIIMALFEVVLFQVNELMVLDLLKATDVGDSLVVHIFGAYFGLAVARVLYKPDIEKEAETKESSVYHSDMFAMIGTIFLWLFWPSFNAGTAVDEGRLRAVINTYYSLTASCIVTFAISSLVHKEKFNMVHIQNSTLAGGVAIGTLADMIIQPWGAILVGSVAGVVSVLGYRYLTPKMHHHLKIHDTCGVHNLHGMPGVISGLGAILAAGLATTELYGDGLHKIFSENRTPGQLAGIQAAGLFVSLGMAIASGTVVGFILRIPIWDQPAGKQIFDDEEYWELPVTQYGVESPHTILTLDEVNNNMEIRRKDLEMREFGLNGNVKAV